MIDHHVSEDTIKKYICKEIYLYTLFSAPIKTIDINETAKERKIKNMYLSLDKNNANQNSPFKISLTQNEKLNVSNLDINKDPKENRVDSLKSNIFHSETKSNENIKRGLTNTNLKNFTENSVNVVSKKINKSNISTAFDWTIKKTDIELKNKSENSKEYDSEKYNPAKMKRRNLVAEFDIKGVKNYNIDLNNTTITDQNEIKKKEISDIMKQKYGTNVSRMKKNFDSISSLNDNESFLNNLKSI